MTSKQFAPHKTVTLDYQSLTRPIHTTNRIERPIYKPKNTSSQANTSSNTVNSWRSPNMNSSHSFKTIGVKRKDQSVGKSFEQMNVTENNSHLVNPKKCSENTTYNFCTSNLKKHFREAENSGMTDNLINAENNSRTANPRKRSREVENSSRHPTAYSSVQKSSTENNFRTSNPKKRFRAENFTKDNPNSAENDSRSAGPIRFMTQKSSPKNNFHNSSIKKRFREVENPCKLSIAQVNFRTTDKKLSKDGNSSKSFTVNNSVQRNGTENNSCLSNSRKHSECSVKRKIVFGVGFDQFSTKALTTRVKNKDLTKDEWEEIRLIKAALINFVNGDRKYKKLKDGELVWSKINAWAYSVFYPEFVKYLDEKLIKRDNVELVIKAIMDYHISRKDRYGRILKKAAKEKRINALIYS